MKGIKQTSLIIIILILSGMLLSIPESQSEPTTTNRAPTGIILSPLNNSQFDMMKKIPFIAEVEDPDGDALTLTWLDNGKELARFYLPNGSGTHSWDRKFNSGTSHTIKLIISDGEMETRYYVSFKIKPTTGEPVPSDIYYLLLFIIIPMIIGGVIIYVYSYFNLKKRR